MLLVMTYSLEPLRYYMNAVLGVLSIAAVLFSPVKSSFNAKCMTGVLGTVLTTASICAIFMPRTGHDAAMRLTTSIAEAILPLVPFSTDILSSSFWSKVLFGILICNCARQLAGAYSTYRAEPAVTMDMPTDTKQILPVM